MGSHASLRRSRHCLKRHDSFDLGSFYTLYEDLNDDDDEGDVVGSGPPPKGRNGKPDEGPWVLISPEAAEQVSSPYTHSHEASTLGAPGTGRSSILDTSLLEQRRPQEDFREVPRALAHEDSPYRPAPALTRGSARPPNDTQQLQLRPMLALPAITRSESRFSEFVQEPKALLPELESGRGWHRYTTVLGGFLACAASLGFLSTIAAFQVYDTDRYPSLSPSEITWLSTCQVFFFLIGGSIAGPLSDRFGPRLMLVAGAILSSLGCAAASFATQFWFFLGTQGVLLGLGASFGFTPAIACVMQCFERRRNASVGVALSGAPTGAVLWPVVVKIITDKRGWKMVWLVVAAAQLLLLGLAALLVRPPSTLLSTAPKDRLNYSPLGNRSAAGRSRHLLHLAAFKVPAYSLSVAGHFFIWVGILYLLFYLPDWATSSGISVAMQSHIPTMISGSAFVGSLLLPLLADLVGRFEVMALCAFNGSVLLLGSIPVHSATVILLVGALYGFATGGTTALQAPVLAEAIDDPEVFGTILGQGLAAVSPAALIGPPLYGLILRAPEGGVACAQVVAGFCMAIGGILIVSGTGYRRWSSFSLTNRLPEQIYARFCLGKRRSRGS